MTAPVTATAPGTELKSLYVYGITPAGIRAPAPPGSTAPRCGC